MESNNKQSTLISTSFLQLLSFAIIWLICAFVGGALLTLWMQSNGWTSMSVILEEVSQSKNVSLINQLRYIQLLGHLSNYLLPALVFAFWWYGQQAWKKMQLHHRPPLPLLLSSLLAIFVLFPFVSWVYYWNMQWLPKDWIGYDKLEMQAVFMNMPSQYELFLNLLLLGVVAALGEELVFRGIIQPILERLTNSIHGSAFLTAALFSFIHFQWEGFLARFILGLLFCYLLIYTRNLWIPIIMHFIFNSMQVINAYFNPEMIKEVGQLAAVPIGIATGSFLLFCIVWKFLIVDKSINYK